MATRLIARGVNSCMPITEVKADIVGRDLRAKFPPALRGVLGVKSLALGGHFVYVLSLQEFYRRQVA